MSNKKGIHPLMAFQQDVARLALHETNGEQHDTIDQHAYTLLDDEAWKGLVDFLTRVKLGNVNRDVAVGRIAGLDIQCLSQALEGSNLSVLQDWMTRATEQREQLASMQAFFTQLSDSTQVLQRSLKEKMAEVSPKIGYANLPNELLLRIFRYTDGISMRHNRERVSLVCRRFRDLIRSVPEFWSVLDNGMSATSVDLHLSRSKNVGLSISILVHDRSGAATIQFTRRVVRECYRWKRFNFEIESTMMETSILERAAEQLQNLQLPLLHEAALSWPLGHEVEGFDELGIDFYTTWNAPSLETAVFENMLPMTNGTFKLETITIDYPQYTQDMFVGWTPVDLGEYLSGQPYLKTLRLGLQCDERSWKDIPTVQVSVPTLRSLHIAGLHFPREYSTPLDTITCILNCLDTPALETLKICIVNKQLKTDDITDLFSGRKYSNLINLSLLVTVHKRSDFKPLAQILTVMPNLQHLKLECPHYPVRVTLPCRVSSNISDGLCEGVPKIIPLRTIHLNGCVGVTDHYINELTGESDSNWDRRNLEGIRVSYSPYYQTKLWESSQ